MSSVCMTFLIGLISRGALCAFGHSGEAASFGRNKLRLIYKGLWQLARPRVLRLTATQLEYKFTAAES